MGVTLQQLHFTSYDSSSAMLVFVIVISMISMYYVPQYPLMMDSSNFAYYLSLKSTRDWFSDVGKFEREQSSSSNSWSNDNHDDYSLRGNSANYFSSETIETFNGVSYPKELLIIPNLKSKLNLQPGESEDSLLLYGQVHDSDRGIGIRNYPSSDKKYHALKTARNRYNFLTFFDRLMILSRYKFSCLSLRQTLIHSCRNIQVRRKKY